MQTIYENIYSYDKNILLFIFKNLNFVLKIWIEVIERSYLWSVVSAAKHTLGLFR